MVLNQKTTTDKNPGGWAETLRANPTSFILPLITVGVVLVLTPLLLMPQLESLLAIRQDISDQHEKLEALVDKRQALEAVNQTEVSEQLAVLERVLPSKKPVFNVIAALGGLVEKTGLVLPSYDFAPGLLASASADSAVIPTEVPGEMASLPVDYQVVGEFNAIYELMNLLEAAAPLASIKEIAINGEIVPDSPDALDGTLTMNMYYAIPKAFVNKPEAPLRTLSAADVSLIDRVRGFEEYRLTESEVPVMNEQRQDLFNY